MIFQEKWFSYYILLTDLISLSDCRLRHMRRAIARTHLFTCLKHLGRAKKSTPCLIKKASRCAVDRTSKTTTFFIFHINAKVLRENHMYLFFISLVQWWKLYYIYISFTQRTADFDRLKKRNMDDRTIVFLTSFLITLTSNILLLFYFWHKTISCFKLKSLFFLLTLAIK